MVSDARLAELVHIHSAKQSHDTVVALTELQSRRSARPAQTDADAGVAAPAPRDAVLAEVLDAFGDAIGTAAAYIGVKHPYVLEWEALCDRIRALSAVPGKV